MTSRLELTRVFTQSDFDRFAALSGDDNPIHVDSEFAAQTRFGRTVAHGVLLVAQLQALAQQIGGGGRLVSQDVRFPAPTFAGEAVTFEAQAQAELGQVRVSARRPDGELTCEGAFEFEEAGR
jgi:acyl dehydratase